MEALAIIGIIPNFAGIISLAIDKAIENVRTANEKVQLIAVELRATAYYLTKLQTLLEEDLKASDDRLFTNEDCRNLDLLVQQCNIIRREIADSFERMGQVTVLDAVTEDQRKLEDSSTAVQDSDI